MKEKVHIILGLMGGLPEDITVWHNEKDATSYEKKLCEKYEVPFERQARHDTPSDNQVVHYVREAIISKDGYCPVCGKAFDPDELCRKLLGKLDS